MDALPPIVVLSCSFSSVSVVKHSMFCGTSIFSCCCGGWRHTNRTTSVKWGRGRCLFLGPSAITNEWEAQRARNETMKSMSAIAMITLRRWSHTNSMPRLRKCLLVSLALLLTISLVRNPMGSTSDWAQSGIATSSSLKTAQKTQNVMPVPDAAKTTFFIPANQGMSTLLDNDRVIQKNSSAKRVSTSVHNARSSLCLDGSSR